MLRVVDLMKKSDVSLMTNRHRHDTFRNYFLKLQNEKIQFNNENEHFDDFKNETKHNTNEIEKNVDETNESKTHDDDELYKIYQKNRKIFEKIRKQLKIYILQFVQIVIIIVSNAKNHFLYFFFEFDFIIVDEIVRFFEIDI